MNVTLRPIGDARYLILRNGTRTGAWVFGTYRGWDVEPAPPRVGQLPHRSFRRVSEARIWLDSTEGQTWLDSLGTES